MSIIGCSHVKQRKHKQKQTGERLYKDVGDKMGLRQHSN